MSEFKGTKGKWKYVNHISRDITHEVNKVMSDSGISICVIRTNNKEQAEHNALLISKAPEMLEMIKELIYQFESNNNSSQETDLLNEAKQLIKEATEL